MWYNSQNWKCHNACHQSHDCLTVSTLFVSNTTQPGVLHDDILMILIHIGRALLTQFNTKTTANTHTHARLTALFPGLPRWAGTRKVKPIWILLKQEPESGSGISWAICKSASYSRQTTTPAPHLSVFLQAGCPSCRPTNSVKALKAKLLQTPTTKLHLWYCLTICSTPWQQ